jgi:hypothetical protein
MLATITGDHESRKPGMKPEVGTIRVLVDEAA